MSQPTMITPLEQGEKTEDKIDHEGVHETDVELETPEYLEYVALDQKFRGETLRKLTVSFPMYRCTV